jgi:hypothetical protein
MLNLGRLLFVSILLSFSFVYAASVKAMVDSIEVVKGNPVTLRIKAVGDNAVFPDIQKVADAPVTGTSTSTSTNLSISNGNMNSEQSVTKIIQFIPKSDMTIPSYSVNIEGKDYQTQSIDIKVVKPNNDSLQGDAPFSLRMQSNKRKVMMGEPFILTVYFSLKDGVRLSQDVQYTAPNISDFIVTNVSEEKVYRQGNHQVQEIRYILTPQKEGNFTISPAQAKIGLPDRSRRDIFGLSYATKWIDTASNTITVEVVPLDEESDLIGDYTINTTVDKTEVKKNKPVNLTLKIEGKGSLEGFEFSEYDIDGVTIYSDDAKTEIKIVDGDVFSTYSKSFAFISDRDFTIPSRELTIYNPNTKEKKSIEVKGFNIKVEGSQSSPVATQTNSLSTPTLKSTQKLEETKEDAEKKEIEAKSSSWSMLALAFVLGMVTMYLLGLLAKSFKAKVKNYKDGDALKILYGHISESKEVEEMVRKLYAKKNGDKSVDIDKKELKELLDRFS